MLFSGRQWRNFPEFAWKLYEKGAAKAAPFGFLPIEL
jgi:hypothetical protein